MPTKVYTDDKDLYDYLSGVYCQGGEREFDWDFMASVFEQPFQVVLTDQVREARMVRSLMNTPAELTPTASTRGMCSAADFTRDGPG